jgi:cytochrome b561
MKTQSIPTSAALVAAQPDTAPRDHHSPWTIALHWSTVIAMLVATASVLWREATENEPLRVALMDIHRQAGVFVLVALGLRLAVRLSIGMAEHAGDMPWLMRWAARLAHVALYVMLFALPLLGLAASNAHAVQVSLFGLVRLPNLVHEDSDLADALTDYHLWAAWAMLLLVAAHVAAACWHHLARKDGVLVAMLPALKRQRRTRR